MQLLRCGINFKSFFVNNIGDVFFLKLTFHLMSRKTSLSCFGLTFTIFGIPNGKINDKMLHVCNIWV